MWIGVEINSHHTWDHDFLVDLRPGPFLTTYGTIGQWSFFSTSLKNAVDRFFWYESTSTVDFNRFWAEIYGLNRRSMRYRPSKEGVIEERCHSLFKIGIDRRYHSSRCNTLQHAATSCNTLQHVDITRDISTSRLKSKKVPT